MDVLPLLRYFMGLCVILRKKKVIRYRLIYLLLLLLRHPQNEHSLVDLSESQTKGREESREGKMATLASTCSSSSSCWSMTSLRFALPTSIPPPTRPHCIRFRPLSSSPVPSKLSSSSRNTTSIQFGSFSGLAPLTPLLSLNSGHSFTLLPNLFILL